MTSGSHGGQLVGATHRPGGFRAGVLWAVLLVAGAGPAAALDPAERPQDYIITRWDAEDGMPQSLVRQITQTRDGYLWVGTIQGVARFDGLTFTNFSAPNTVGFPGNTITDLAETADGSLWIASSAGLGRYEDGRFTSYRQADGLKADTINALCVAPDGSLWIGSRAGIVRWVDGKFVQDIDTTGYNTLSMEAITADRRGAMWLATGVEALRYADGKFTRFGQEHGLPASGIRAIREDAAGAILVVSQRGLFRLEGDRFMPFRPAPTDDRLNTTFVDSDGVLWIGSAAGLDRFANGAMEPYTDAHGSKLGAIDRVFEDREGALWIGGSAGLARITNRRGRTLSHADGVLGSYGLAIHQSRDGSVWMSSWAGGVVRQQGGQVRQYRVGAPLSHDSITCIYQSPDGTMWFGNRGSAVDRLDGDQVTTFVYPSGVPTSRYVSAMYADPGGDLLVAIAGRGLLALRNGELVPVPAASALASGIIWSIHRTRAGRLLLGGSSGLHEQLADGAVRPVALAGLNDRPLSVRGMMEEADGAIWLATDGHGLVYWKDGQARAYAEREGMIGDSVAGVLDDRAGSIWVTGSRGLARIPRSQFTDLKAGKISRLNITTFGRGDGLINPSVLTAGNPVAARLEDGRLRFGTGTGFAEVDPRSLQLNTRPPTVVVEGIIADDDVLPLERGRPVVIPAGTNSLELRYTALSLISPHRLRFRYQLVGSDPAWVEAGRERSARYTHLAPGAYTFRVLASNSDGVWSETGATLALTIRPFFYQTGWFLGLMAVSGGLAFFGVYRARLRLTRQRMIRLEALVGERTRELRQSKDAAEAAREEIARERARFKFIFEALPVGVTWQVSERIETRLVNSEHARITGITAGAGAEHLDEQATHPDDRALQADLRQRLQSGRSDRYALEKRYVRTDGTVVWAALTVRSFHDPALGEAQQISTLIDITARKEAEANLQRVHQQLLAASRQAGKAEVATNVLHNVGNVLNSVNVSVTLVVDRVRQTKSVNIAKVAALLEQHQADLPGFFSRDARGQKIPGFLRALAETVAAEQQAELQELEHLRKNVEHIKDIVAMQQSNARTSGFYEEVAIGDLIDDALRINASSLNRHEVEVDRDIQATGTMTTDKHKVMQILINLVRNAKQACDDSGRLDKRITVRVTQDERHARIAIHDNGIGIPHENRTRIFNHGFTTRKNGHGFGLHSGALAAKEMGGSLHVESEGPGAGATFTLVLPLQPVGTASAGGVST